MKRQVILCGGGPVGPNVARVLAGIHHFTVVELAPGSELQAVADRLVPGDGTDPEVLTAADAGARTSSSRLPATTAPI
jgi:Trk K+ transport system NAD-binding subunit